MGVNHLSIKDLRPIHGWGNLCHMQSYREKGKRGSVVKGRERACTTRIVEENWRNSGNRGSSEHRRRRVTFVLDYFSVLGEGE
jgi:hypothetical protein